MIFLSVKVNKDGVEIAEAEELSKKLILKDLSSLKIDLSTINSSMADAIASAISFSRNINEKITRISFCIDSNFAFLNTIPVDANLDQQSFDEHLKWEISQFFPNENISNFIIRGYKFSKENGAYRTLLVAVRKEITLLLKAVAEKLNLKLQIIDIDHFAVENCLRQRISSARSRFIYKDFLLIGVKNSRIDASHFRNYEFAGYTYHTFQSESDAQYFVIKLINDSISLGYEKFIFYGEGLEKVKLNLLQELLVNRFLILDPMNLNLFLDLKVKTQNAHIYAPNIGLILRMLWSG